MGHPTPMLEKEFAQWLDKFYPCKVEAINQLLVGSGLFHGIEIGPLHIFDNGQLERLRVRQIAHDHRHHDGVALFLLMP